MPFRCFFLIAAALLLNTADLVAQSGLRLVGRGLVEASGLDITPAGDIYILESGRNRVLKLNTDGIRTDSLGAAGGGDYQFDKPTGIDVTNGMKIYVADPNNNRVQLFDRRAQNLGSLKLQGNDNRDFDPKRVRVNSSGDVLAWTARKNTIVQFGHTGRAELEIGPLQQHGVGSVEDILVTSRAIFIADAQNGVLHRFGLNGEYQQFLAGFDNVVALASHGNQVVALSASEIILCNESGVPETRISVQVKSYVDFKIWGGEAFLLTSSNLYAVRLP